MRYSLLLLGLLCLVSCRNTTEDIRLDKFVWIQHKRGWNSDAANWEANVYVEFLNSCHKVRLAKTDSETKQTEYLIARAPDSLKSTVIKYLYKTGMPTHFKYPEEAIIDDGDIYCLIYKFADDTLKFVNYNQSTLPDSLKGFVNDIENLQHLYTYTKTDSFDRATIINDYRDIIEQLDPFYPPPPLSKEGEKFTPPIIKQN